MMGKEIKAKKQAEARNFWETKDANRGDYRRLFGLYDTGINDVHARFAQSQQRHSTKTSIPTLSNLV